MRKLMWIVPFVLLTASCAIGQEATPSTTIPPAETKAAKVMVYTIGPGVTAPELLPSDPLQISAGKCKKKVKSSIPVSIYVNADGMPRDLTLLYPNKSKLDELALKIVSGDRFKPGTYTGHPVPVAENVLVTLNVCMDEQDNLSKQQTNPLLLSSQPEQKAIPLQKPPESDETLRMSALQKIEPGVIPPVQVHNVEPEFTDEARRAKFQGIVVVSIIVDAQGMPRDLHVVRALGMGLDQKAIEAVMKYRFKPAMKDGKPVPVKVNVEINFRLFLR